MKRLTLALLLLMAAVVSGCIVETKPSQTQVHPYVAPTSPEKVIQNLAALYINMDLVEYDSTLAPDFVFRFAPGDISQGQADSLTRAEEMAFAENLFVNGAGEGAPRATRIQLVLQTASGGDDNRIGHTGWKRYYVNTNLSVSFTNANPIQVTGPALMYFRQVPEGSGRWRLAEWIDQPVAPSGGAPGRVSPRGALAADVTTWGMVRRLYR
jgi:hypothetical protein